MTSNPTLKLTYSPKNHKRRKFKTKKERKQKRDNLYMLPRRFLSKKNHPLKQFNSKKKKNRRKKTKIFIKTKMTKQETSQKSTNLTTLSLRKVSLCTSTITLMNTSPSMTGSMKGSTID